MSKEFAKSFRTMTRWFENSTAISEAERWAYVRWGLCLTDKIAKNASATCAEFTDADAEVLYLLRESERMPEALIDQHILRAARAYPQECAWLLRPLPVAVASSTRQKTWKFWQ